MQQLQPSQPPQEFSVFVERHVLPLIMTVTQPEDIQLYTDDTTATVGSLANGRLSLSVSSPHETYPVIIEAILWGHEWARYSILIHSDNSAVGRKHK